MSTATSPFHRGEQAIQARMGVREQIEPWARKVVYEHLPQEHRDFYAGLPFLVAAARDAQGRPWATVLEGAPGFAESPHAGALRIAALPAAGDALADAFTQGADLGLLGIELHTRRRNRLNGRIVGTDSDGFELSVGQAFGNCPQHIRERHWHREEKASVKPLRRDHVRMGDRLRAKLEAADTFFIASGHRGEGESATFGMDVSHRGGEPGFVRVVDDNTLLFADYAGNNHYNTFGNLLVDPRAGLLFVDFASGDLLQLTGTATVEWEHPEVTSFPGGQRLVRFELEHAVEVSSALALRWDVPAVAARPLRLAEKIRESAEVTSFVFESADGCPLEPFEAGQHLPLEVETRGRKEPVVRTYSLSGAPGDARYRITVKREELGMVSRHLHDHVSVGDTLRARSPGGDFTLRPTTARPVVFLSAGVGVTPMVSMLHALVDRDEGTPIWFVHTARDGRHHPLAQEVRELAARRSNVRLHVAYTRPQAADVAGRDFQTRGRIDARRLREIVAETDADFYLCGPTVWMASVSEALEAAQVPSERIHMESFGGS